MEKLSTKYHKSKPCRPNPLHHGYSRALTLTEIKIGIIFRNGHQLKTLHTFTNTCDGICYKSLHLSYITFSLVLSFVYGTLTAQTGQRFKRIEK